MPKRTAAVLTQDSLNKRACTTSILDFESLPMVQTAIESNQLVEYPCFTALPKDDETPLEFRIDKTDAFVDLTRTFLSLKIQVLDGEGNKLATTANVGPINNIAYSMFDGVELYINDQKITGSDSYYPWVTYVYSLLYNSKAVKKTILQGASWHADTASLFDTVKPEAAEDPKNEGFEYRKQSFADSKQVSLYTRLFLTSNFNRLIPAQTEITIKFNRKPATFALMAEEGAYKIRVKDAKLYAMRINVADRISQECERLAASRGLLYPTTNILTRTKTVSKGDQNLEWVPFNGKLPQRIYIWQVLQGAYNGEINRNPFNFQDFKMARLQVFKNGLCLPTSQGQGDMIADNYLKCYLNTLAAMNSPETIPFNIYQFRFGYMVIAVDLTNDSSSGCPYDNPTHTGTLRIAIDYKSALAQPITVFCMGEMDSAFKLDGDRNITWLD